MPEPLERQLAELAAQVEFPPTPDLAPAVRARLAAPRRRRLLVPARRSLALAALVLLLLAAVAGAVPAVRDAVGDLLGIGGASVERVPELPRAPGAVDPGRPVTGLPLRVPHDGRLGSPDGSYLRGRGRVAQATLLYRPAPALPAIAGTRIGLLLTQFRGDLDPDLVEKFIGPGTGTRHVRVRGSRGFWIDGPHTFAYRDADGLVRVEERRLAGRTLLWRSGQLLFRLESELPLGRALEIARTVE